MSAIGTARRLIVQRYADQGDPRNDGTDLIIHSVAVATLALAEEQHTANLIALFSARWRDESHAVGTAALEQARAQIAERLGLSS